MKDKLRKKLGESKLPKAKTESYQEKIDNLVPNEEFDNVSCFVSKQDIMTSTEPIFFMSNSLCNIPSPITIPAMVYVDGIGLAEHWASENKIQLPKERGMDVVGPIPYLLHELECSITNLIISSLYDCIDHILGSDIFMDYQTNGLPLRDQILSYDKVYSAVDEVFPVVKFELLDVIKASTASQMPIKMQTYITSHITARATQVFTDLANEYANNFSCLYAPLNPNSVLLKRISKLNPIANFDVTDTRNILFAALSAMFCNYAWSFSGFVDVEVNRIIVSIIRNLNLFNSKMDHIEEDYRATYNRDDDDDEEW